MNHQPVWHWYD